MIRKFIFCVCSLISCSVFSQVPVKTIGPACETAILNAAFQFADKSVFSRYLAESVLQASNDEMCPEDDEVWMANVAIVLSVYSDHDKQIRELFVGVFHLHFEPDGKLITAPTNGSFFEKMWLPIDRSSLWLTRWCEAIHTVYPDDAKKWECELYLPKHPSYRVFLISLKNYQ